MSNVYLRYCLKIRKTTTIVMIYLHWSLQPSDECRWLKVILICLQVSWIRKRDLHILTVGILTYTTDQRFQTVHRDGSDEWTLKISSPQLRDSGTYECQVSTESKISQAFNLSVVGWYIWHAFCIYLLSCRVWNNWLFLYLATKRAKLNTNVDKLRWFFVQF